MEQEIIENLDDIIGFFQNIYPCSLKNFGEKKIIDSGVSPTYVAKGQLSKENKKFALVLKVWFDWNGVDISKINTFLKSYKIYKTKFDSYMETVKQRIVNKIYKSLEYEKCVYMFITENIIRRGYSPNFIPLISYRQCELKIFKSAIPFSEDTKEYLKEIEKNFPEVKVRYLMTGSTVKTQNLVKLKDIAEFLNKPENNFEFKSILFQLVYSLAVLNHFKIIHNDMHAKNIFIQILDNYELFSYTINGKMLQIRTKYVVKFFDWDRAYCEYLGNNEYLEHADFLKMLQQTNYNRKTQDFYQVLCFIKKYPNLWTLTKKILKTIPEELIINFRQTNSDPKIKKKFKISDNQSDFKSLEKILKNSKILPTTDKIFWVSIKTENLKQTQPAGRQIFAEFKNVYKLDPENLEEIFLGIKFLPNDVEIYFSAGWLCQSLFDFKESIFPTALTYLESKHFQQYFTPKTYNNYLTYEVKRNYTFPTQPYNGIVSPCKFLKE